MTVRVFTGKFERVRVSQCVHALLYAVARYGNCFGAATATPRASAATPLPARECNAPQKTGAGNEELSRDVSRPRSMFALEALGEKLGKTNVPQNWPFDVCGTGSFCRMPIKLAIAAVASSLSAAYTLVPRLPSVWQGR